jgi:purine-binding chemotaxis protein CheW
MPSTGKIRKVEDIIPAGLKTGEIQLICVEIGDHKFGMEVTWVEEVIRPGEIHDDADSAPYVTGLISWRGQNIPLVNMRIRLEYEIAEKESEDRFVIVNLDGRLFAVQVDHVTEIIRILDTDIDESAQYRLPPPLESFVKGVCKDEDGLIYILDCRRLIGK